ncbi:BRCA1-A complex subunit RAP80 isoform X2 [Latimeria chalumnae]|nr:PREDICTED: BRCA1-A complex subunit RAP80 isoform X2 [Latimeria chalumnae]|eukprot:XP_005992394.1 PREDICTED: BRCA1-A complex subunit RAP80 isoform X2 [Latimeria chalumnae]
MPRKKRSYSETTDLQCHEEEVEKGKEKGWISVKKKRSGPDVCIVISDSDDGEENHTEENGLQKKRETRKEEREKMLAKRRISQMTEEEQLAMAVQMSKQEANQLNSQQVEEDELLKKAIAESLNSCKSSCHIVKCGELQQQTMDLDPQHVLSKTNLENPIRDAACESSQETSDSSSQFLLRTKKSNTDELQPSMSPKVVLERLSEDILQSSLESSIVLSPVKNQTQKTNLISPPTFSDSSTSLNLSPWTLPQLNSQTGSQTPYSFRKISPRKLFVESEKCLKEQYQRSDEESLECQKVLSKEDINGSQIEQEDFVESGLLKRSRRNLTFKHCSRQSEDLETQQNSRKRKYVNKPFLQPEKSNIKPRNSLSQEPFSKDDDGGIVHYYWGIPFCPKGADPDQYTKVILCQLEVYEKSLKQAQKQLLRKVEYGNPVLPQSNAFPSWRRERGKAEQSLEDDDEITGEKSSKNSDEEDKVDDEKEEAQRVKCCPSAGNIDSGELLQQANREEENLSPGHEIATGQKQCSSQSLFAEETPEEEECTQSASWLNPISYTRGDTKVRTENPAADEEITVCPETQQSPSEAVEPDVVQTHCETKGVSTQAAGAASVVNNDIEDVPIASTSTEKYMECPLCRQKFPLEKIEAHAAYCSDMGAEEESEEIPVLTRRQRGRRNETNDTFISSKYGKCEKCYVCKSLVSSEEYQNHVDNCLKTDTDTQKSRRTKRVKEVVQNGGRLLVLLDQSELRTTGNVAATTSNQKASRNMALKSETEEEGKTMNNGREESPPCDSPDHLNLSDSPIRSFTSISEASNCLIDFKQQFASRSSSGKENKARRGRRKRH